MYVMRASDAIVANNSAKVDLILGHKSFTP
jgi:hypothetical protein